MATYYVESGYGLCDRFGWSYKSAAEAYQAADQADHNRENYTIRRDGKIITLDELLRDARKEMKPL